MSLDSFRRPETKKRIEISIGMKMILLLSVFLGFYARSCYFKTKENLITFENIRYEANLPGSCDVEFDTNNKTSKKGKEYVMITLYDQDETPVARKLTQIYLHPNKVKRYRKVVSKFDRRMMGDDVIMKVTVAFHKPSIFRRN